jgi:hypothetical protein
LFIILDESSACCDITWIKFQPSSRQLYVLWSVGTASFTRGLAIQFLLIALRYLQ